MGIRVDSENHVSSIVPGSVAADEGRIAVGDKIITVRRVVKIIIRFMSDLEGNS